MHDIRLQTYRSGSCSSPAVPQIQRHAYRLKLPVPVHRIGMAYSVLLQPDASFHSSLNGKFPERRLQNPPRTDSNTGIHRHSLDKLPVRWSGNTSSQSVPHFRYIPRWMQNGFRLSATALLAYRSLRSPAFPFRLPPCSNGCGESCSCS